ncbi:type I restriction enzyme HsdR N-terminal domain-containing protein [Alkaliflexus imshenetskii]|uniref:type I restriction enzyme HsdR N-terminal domain-containing protein n=1 Tax=Alkaliflexus imshenetskii TaxID=286730 RepID=UPI00047E8149|nr:type I restriction enzyme HsdR N-terminal domain-containing protein [Alkaliflexus imshenetskii]
MQPLSLPPFDARITEENGKKRIFDVIRKKYVSLSPEEWVRQHFIHFLLSIKYPAALMAIEKNVTVNGLKQRADIVVYNRLAKPMVIVECKAPGVIVDNTTIAQAARYNISLEVPYLVVTNGINNYCIRVDKTTGTWQMETTLPEFTALNALGD